MQSVLDALDDRQQRKLFLFESVRESCARGPAAGPASPLLSFRYVTTSVSAVDPVMKVASIARLLASYRVHAGAVDAALQIFLDARIVTVREFVRRVGVNLNTICGGVTVGVVSEIITALATKPVVVVATVEVAVPPVLIS